MPTDTSQYNIFDLGFDQYLVKGASAINSTVGSVLDDMPMPSILGSGFYEIPPSQIGSGEIGQNLTLVAGLIQSANFVTGVSGWWISYDGDVEFNEGTFRGSLIAGSIHIPDQDTTDNSFHTNSGGNSWWGCTETDFNADNDNANAFILNTGEAKLQVFTLAPGSLQAGSEIAIQGWQSDLTFSSTDYRITAWTSGTITLLDGTTYSITSGNTGNMAAATYIYLDIGTSETVLQTTTTAATAVGTGKILIAVAENNSDTSGQVWLQVLGGSGGIFLGVDNLSANSTSTNEFVANTANIADAIITNAKIDSLAVSKLTAGTITSQAITLAVTPAGGDTKIQAGKTDFGQWTTNGFILGIDDSDSDKVKFELTGGNITSGIFQTATTGQRIVIDASDNYMKVYSSTALVGSIGASINGDAFLQDWSIATDTSIMRLSTSYATGSAMNIYSTNYGVGINMYLRSFNTSATRTQPMLYVRNAGYGPCATLFGSSNTDIVLRVLCGNSTPANAAISVENGAQQVRFQVDDEGNTETGKSVIIGDLTRSGKGYLHIKGDDDGDDKPGVLVLYDAGGTANYIWVDGTGDLRIDTTDPADEYDGTVVGTQS